MISTAKPEAHIHNVLVYQLFKKSAPIFISLLLVGGAVSLRYDVLGNMFSKEISYYNSAGESTKRLAVTAAPAAPPAGGQNDWQTLLNSFSETEVPYSPPSGTAQDAINAPQPTAAEPAQTLTSAFAKSLVDQYYKLQQTAPDLPFEAVQNVAFEGKFLNDAVDAYFKGIVPLTADRVVSLKDNSVESKKLYFNRVAGILKVNFPFEKTESDSLPTEFQIFLGALENRQYANLSALSPYYRAYNTAARQLAGLATPEQYKDFHVQLVNSFLLSAYALNSMENFGGDSLKGTLGFISYSAQIDNSGKLIKTLESFIARDNLAFSENEDGFLFYQYVSNG